jgi:hypothetical protein
MTVQLLGDLAHTVKNEEYRMKNVECKTTGAWKGSTIWKNGAVCSLLRW